MAKKTKPNLYNELQAMVITAVNPKGQWTPRKGSMVNTYYEQAGGDYENPRKMRVEAAKRSWDEMQESRSGKKKKTKNGRK